MKKMNQYKQMFPFLIGIIVIFSVGGYFIYQNFQMKVSSADAKTIQDIDTKLDTDDGEEDVDWSKYSEYQMTTGDSTKITKGGIYYLSGSFTETVTIETTDNVKLVLNGVDIKVQSGAGIVVEEANMVVISLAEGTVSTIEDSSSYSYTDTDIDGAIYSKDDLIFEGKGTLKVVANYQDGIVGKDDLKIIDGKFEITSEDDGIRGKDSLYIQNGEFEITAGGDGIKSTNDTEEENGYILIENGKFQIDAELDGMQAETKIVIQDGEFSITTGGGSNNSSTQSGWGSWGRASSTTTTFSAKGIKAVDNLVIYNGTFSFDTSDDAIHSNRYVGIENGTFDIASGDDGIHADTQLIVDGGTIKITKSYEGLEAAEITLNGGEIEIVASDDGINVAGGNDSSSMNRPGENNYSGNTNQKLVIQGGTIYVNAVGDGIDVNGSAYVYGGDIRVDGPVDDGNGTLDYDREFVVDGGSLLAAGSNGMLQSITSNKQYNVTISFNSTYQADSKVSILNANGEEVVSYTPSKKFSSLIVSSSALEANQTYTIQVNGSTYQKFTTSSFSNQVGTLGGGGGMMANGGGDPGRR